MNNTTAAIASIHRIHLPFWTCFFLNSDNGSYATVRPDLVLSCSPQGKFLFGNGPTSSIYGHAVCIAVVVSIWIFGLIGLGSNTLCIVLIPKSMKNLVGSVSFLVVALAVLETITCVTGVISATAIILILENAARSKVVFYLLYIVQPIYSFGRVAVIYTTILISIERYLVVTYPTRSRSWLTSSKSKLSFVPVIIFALALELPWLLNVNIGENEYRSISPHTSLAEFPYIFQNSRFGKNGLPKVWFVLMLLKSILPIPAHLYFNGMLYKSIRMWNKRKRALTNRQKREIDAATMLSSVVILIFLWNLPYFISFIVEHVYGDLDEFYRELVLFKLLCMIISTNVNFIMYFRFARRFRSAVIQFTGIKWDDEDSSPSQMSNPA